MKFSSIAAAGMCLLASACASAATFDTWIPDGDGGIGASDGAPSKGGIAPATNDLPCDVHDLMQSRCGECHGIIPQKGAKSSLVSLAGLKAPAVANPGISEAEASLLRMKDAKAPMPPSGLLSPSDVATFEAWVKAGMKPGTCGAPKDAGSPRDPAYDVASMCSSNLRWILGDQKSFLMHPGVACVECHRRKATNAIYSIAGTVYPTPHEPDDCFGTSSRTAKVVVTDARDRSVTLSLSPAGNFYARDVFTYPIRVKIVDGTKVRPMLTPLTENDGDCNRCHTQEGQQGALGRVFLP